VASFYRQSNHTMPRGILMLLTTVLILLTLSISGCGSQKSSVADRNLKTDFQENAAPAEYDQAGEYAQSEKTGEFDRKIIQNISLTLEVSNVQESLDRVVAIGHDFGGYTVETHLYKDGALFKGRLTLKIPQDKVYDAIDMMAQTGQITNKNISTSDVTEEYYDSQARLEVLTKKEERLISFMDQAKDISEVVLLENELTKVRSDIEVLQGRMNYLKNATSYSQIQIRLVPIGSQTINTPEGVWNKAVYGFISSINSLINFLSLALVWLVAAIPWLALLAIVYLVVRKFKDCPGKEFLSKLKIRKPKENKE
jgi:hypothetical protein